MQLAALRRRSLGRGALRVRRQLAAPPVSKSFVLALQTTLVPEKARGSPTPTFTRATTAYATDFEGRLVLLPSGAARMQGTRIVQNLIRFTENFSNVNWTNGGTVVTGKTDPLGGTAAARFTATGANQEFFQSVTGIVGTAVSSIYIRRVTGTGAINLYAPNGVQLVNVASILTSSWKRFTYGSVAIASGINYLDVQIVTSGDEIEVAFPMWEHTTGQANSAPSEYVSRDTLSAPYHGLGTDGIKSFSTLNGNTVSSNVVTESVGAHIDSSQSAAAGGVTAGVVDATGPRGLLTEASAQNVILQSNTLDTTWTVSNASDMNAVAADAYVSVDGTTTMDKLQPKATNAVHSLDQAFTFTAAKYTTCADLRYVSATPQRWVALILNDGTTTWGASFDLSLGVVGAVSAGATSAIYPTSLANVYRVCVTNTANAAAAAGTVKISLNATDTATLESASRAGTETLGAGMVQHEVGTIASSRITTTTTAVTRNADVEQYVSANNLSATAMTIAEELAPSTALGSAVVYHTYTYVDANNGTGTLSDGTNYIARKRIGGTNHDSTIAWNRAVGVPFKGAARFDGTHGVDSWGNGTKGTNDPTLTASQIGTNFQIGADGNGAGQDYCMHSNFRVWLVVLSDAMCAAMST